MGAALGYANSVYNTVNNWFSSDKDKSGESQKTSVYAPDRQLPRDENGNPVPESSSPHTQLGKKVSKNTGKTYPQACEFDENSKTVRDIDFTDHGRPKEHTNPHQHKYDPKSGKRGSAEELK